jgi:hypothetical protein
MDLQKTRKPKSRPHDKQEEGPEYGVEGYGRTGDSGEAPEDDVLNHHRQESDGNNKKKNKGKNINNRGPVEGNDHRNEARSLISPAHDSEPTADLLTLTDARCHGRQPSLKKIMRVPKALQFDTEKIHQLRSAEPLPPVTKAALSELDLERTQANVHLRLDINFDSDLHFQPGDKGEKKERAADDYWEALATEMSIYAFCSQNQLNLYLENDPNSIDQVIFKPRLPAMFETLRDVLQTLVPEHAHPSVTQILDVSLRMQEVERGVLDLEGLSEWLKDFLQLHCAPMRDAWADLMAKQIKAGFNDGDVGEVTKGLRTLFGILEAMKLVSGLCG